MAEARSADEEIAAGHVRGPLHGVPIAVKDLLWTAGVPTAHGMSIHRAYCPTEDATVVRRLRSAGAVILGKLQQTESAFVDHHPQVVPPVNPWSDALWTGVSSSGSGVATAAGLCYGSLGSDTGGSIRHPCAANGVTGIKPTWGRVSRHGCFELAASLDHIGPMARSVADVAAMLGVIAGVDPLDPTASARAVPDYLGTMTQGLEGVRVGIDGHWTLDLVDPATRDMLQSVCETLIGLGASIRDVVFPDVGPVVQDWLPLCAVECAVAHRATFPARRDDYGPTLQALLDLGHSMRATDHQQLLLRRADFSGRVRAVFGQVDLLLVPVCATAGLTLDRVRDMASDNSLITLGRYTFPFDISGNPALTLPGGITKDGTPLGFQLVAPHFDEAQLLQAGWAFQRATAWHRRHPAL